MTCDCYEVTLMAYHNNQPWATFSYGWNSWHFYHRRGMDSQHICMLMQGFENPKGPQSQYTGLVIEQCLKLVKEPRIINKIKQRYARFKDKSHVLPFKLK